MIAIPADPALAVIVVDHMYAPPPPEPVLAFGAVALAKLFAPSPPFIPPGTPL
jgi:hypothetical protein